MQDQDGQNNNNNIFKIIKLACLSDGGSSEYDLEALHAYFTINYMYVLYG